MTSKQAPVFFLLFAVIVAAECRSVANAQGRVQTRIVSTAELVEVPVIVFDNKGAVPTDLKKSDFRVFEDGVEQRVLRLDRERVPVSFVVVADLSGSMTRKIPFVQEAALSLLDPVEPGDQDRDEYSVLGVGTRSRLLLSFTRDHEDLEKNIPLLLTARDESTALFDGVWLGVSTAEQRAANKHRAMIVITDGGDNHSRYNLRETKRLLEEADVPVFAVMAGPSFKLPALVHSEQGSPTERPGRRGRQMGMPHLPGAIMVGDYIGPAERRGPHSMKVLAEASGGGVFTAKREEDLIRIVRTIGLAVRYRYVVSYEPAGTDGFNVNRVSVKSHHGPHDIVVKLYPKSRFAGYSLPYYKRHYYRAEQAD